VPHHRYFVETLLSEGQILTITGDECHHLVRVLRAQPQDAVEVINGKNQLAKAIVSQISKNAAALQVIHVYEENPKPPIILALAISRMNHLEWIIEKGTELNATAFWLFPGTLSEKETLSPTQQERLRHLSIAAMKQCGRLDLPEILCKPALSQWQPIDGTLLFGDTSKEAPYFWDCSFSSPLPFPLIWFVGPEKGFDERERHCLLHSLHAQGVRLHVNILRAETAPLVALSLSQSLITI
jgi:16S rRNA (uracil1498-N3)-methyltransferase